MINILAKNREGRVILALTMLFAVIASILTAAVEADQYRDEDELYDAD